MKSVKLIARREFGIFDEERPVLDEQKNVLIRIASVGVCGSDMHYFQQGRIGTEVIEFPFTIGHEAAGYIEEISGEAKGLKLGRLVAIEPAVACGRCDQCLAGRPHTCRKILFMGAAGEIEGLSKEFVAISAKNVVAVPEHFTPDEAAFVEPMSIGAYAVKLGRISKSDGIGIIGVGPIGMSVLLSLKYEGNHSNYIWDKLDYRLEKARKAGAIWTGNPEKIDVEAELRKVVPEELDVVFECCGEQEALDLALKVLKPGGKLVIVGIPAEERISFDMNHLRRKEIEIINVRRQNHSIPDAIKVIDRYKSLCDMLLTHTFDYTQMEAAFQMVSDYADNVIKASIHFNAG